MAMLQHPYIVPHVESWVTQGHTVNVVLGYCERGDLGTLLEKRKVRGLPACPRTLRVP
jgi:NIMA (never in mitosis gene a)-related kinase